MTISQDELAPHKLLVLLPQPCGWLHRRLPHTTDADHSQPVRPVDARHKSHQAVASSSTVPTHRRRPLAAAPGLAHNSPMVTFILWFAVLFVLYQAKAAWWVWAIFLLGSFLVFMGTG